MNTRSCTSLQKTASKSVVDQLPSSLLCLAVNARPHKLSKLCHGPCTFCRSYRLKMMFDLGCKRVSTEITPATPTDLTEPDTPVGQQLSPMDHAPSFYGSAFCRQVPDRDTIPEHGMPARYCERAIQDYHLLDSNERLNTSSYVNVIFEPEEVCGSGGWAGSVGDEVVSTWWIFGDDVVSGWGIFSAFGGHYVSEHLVISW